jgi:hypothetical protein
VAKIILGCRGGRCVSCRMLDFVDTLPRRPAELCVTRNLAKVALDCG